MSNPTMMPCPQWAERLAKVHAADLSPLEREELEAHLAACPACTAIRAQYDHIVALLDDFTVDDVPTDIPPKLAQLWQEEARPHQLHKPVSMHTRGVNPVDAPTARRKKRLTGLMSAIAAVLIVGILLGAVVTHLSGNNQSGRSSGGTTSGVLNVGITDAPVFWHSNVYIFTGTVIAAFHSNNGSLIRTYNIGNSKYTRIKPSTPVIVDGIMYVIGTAWPDPTTFGFDSIYALRLSDGALLWHTPVNDTKMLPPAIADAITIADGIVYATINAHTQYLYALRASDGVLLWKYKAGKPYDAVLSLPSVAHGVAYVGVVLNTQNLDTENAYLVALNTRDGSLLWQRKVEGKQFVGPAAIANVVYASSQGFVSALRSSDGSLLWQHHFAGSWVFPGVPTIVNGIAYIAADQYIYALHANNGTLLWSHKLANSSSSVSDLTLANGLIYVSVGGTQASDIDAVSLKDGHIVWQYKLGSHLIPSLAYGDGAIYFEAPRVLPHQLNAVRASNGEVLWHTNIPYCAD